MFKARSARDEALGIEKRSASFTPDAGGSNVAEVTIQVLDSDAVAAPGYHQLLIWLSDDAGGEGITATSASGTVTAKASSGTVMGALTAKKVILAQTLKDGSFILEITDTAKTAFYVCAQFLDQADAAEVSAVLATADYG